MFHMNLWLNCICRQIISRDAGSVDERIHFLSDGSLEITNVQTSDARNYAYYDGQDTVTVPLIVYGNTINTC